MDYKKQGKKNLAAGRRFELKVRKDLESKGWIISRWNNNVEFIEKVDGSFEFGEGEVYNEGKCIPAKQGRFRKTSTGFPDFIAYKKEDIYRDRIIFNCIFVECKTNSYLSKEEKAKAKWYLNNNYCSKFLIAKKGKKRGEIEYVDFST
jgi:hypothetical protein